MSKSIFKELNSVKFLMLAGHKVEAKVSPFYTFDRYKKQVSCLLTFYWDNPSDDVLLFRVDTKVNRRTLTSGNISMNNGTKHSMLISFNQSDLKGNTLDINLIMDVQRKVDVKKMETRHYSTGISWWKEHHTYQSPVTVKEQQSVDNKTISLRQTLKIEKDKIKI